MGRTIMTVSQGMKEFGTYSLNIDTRSLAQGIYHAVISINGMSGAIGITAGDNIDIIKSGATYSIRLSPNVIIDGG